MTRGVLVFILVATGTLVSVVGPVCYGASRVGADVAAALDRRSIVLQLAEATVQLVQRGVDVTEETLRAQRISPDGEAGFVMCDDLTVSVSTARHGRVVVTATLDDTPFAFTVTADGEQVFVSEVHLGL